MQEATVNQHITVQRILPWVIVTGIACVLALIVVLISTTERDVFDSSPKVFGGDFTLQAKTGDVSLSDFRGKVVLMYFGFLSCAEVCPASMTIYQQTLYALNENEVAEVQPIMITIDPERDNAEALDEFGKYYHHNIIGLTGATEAIRNVADQYGAYFKKEFSDKSGKYFFEHTSRYYVIDQEGNLVDAMRHSTTSNELVARIRTLL